MPAVVQQLLANGILLDAIVISHDIPYSLMPAARITGGGIFSPRSIAEAEPLFQNEAFFNPALREFDPPIRDPVETILASVQRTLKFDANVRTGVRAAPTGLATAAWVITKVHPSTMRDTRLITELSYIVWNGRHREKPPTYEVFVSMADIGEWFVPLRGSSATLYDGRWCLLAIHFPSLYPANAPTLRFLRAPYHANITEDGRVHLLEVQEYYDETMHVFEMIEEIRLLLAKNGGRRHPNLDL
jgi:ubiquitin-protein ligase